MTVVSAANIALEEILRRCPEWDVDFSECKLSQPTVRGWDTMPAVLR